MSTPEAGFDPADVEALTRLANEFFKAVPGTGEPAAPASAPPLARAQADPTGAGPPATAVQVPPPHPLSEAPPHLALPQIYGAAAEIPHVPSRSVLPGEAYRQAQRRDQPPYYFLGYAGLRGAPTVQLPLTTPVAPLDAHRIRRDFPLLAERINGRPLVWLDNAATTQKPQCVIDRLATFYRRENSNIHRAAHELAARATDAYEAARGTAQRFLNAASPAEIVFVRGATEGINLVAQSWGRANIRAGDEIIVSLLEHHANIVPWKRLADEVGATLRVIPVDDRGQLILEEYARLLGPRTRLVSVTQVSNALGTVTPTQEIAQMAHAAGAHVLIDGAQSVLHQRTDVQALGADWFVFSGHKIFGPTGIGVLYGRKAVLDAMPPWQGGGNMIEDVTFERIRYQDAPMRFEAGTGNIADAAGLAAALDYVSAIGLDAIAAHEHQLLEHGTRLLGAIPGLRLIGTAPGKAGVLSFVLDGVETTKIGALLNKEGIAVRAGHHCAQPILRRFGLEATVRPSLAVYNTMADLDALADAVRRIRAGRLA